MENATVGPPEVDVDNDDLTLTKEGINGLQADHEVRCEEVAL